MPNNLSEQIRQCDEQVVHCARQADAQTDPGVKRQFLELKRLWLLLARGLSVRELSVTVNASYRDKGGEISRKVRDGSMEHRGVRYTIRAGIERGIWSVAIHPGGVESAARLVYGKRQVAEFEAHSMIDRWSHKYRRRSKLKTATDVEQKSLDE